MLTGAARGIGAAIATAFVEYGAFVHLTDIDDAPGQALAGALVGKASHIPLDVREESHWEAAKARAID